MIPTRVDSIDILRALTMVLMIFVNDLWSLSHIPAWLEHVDEGVDGLGLADVVFPAFLFIFGLSLPYAIEVRRSKGDSVTHMLGHVLLRSVALLVMGVFLVNGETIHEAATGMSRALWNTLSCLSFLLIWNAYPKTMSRLWVHALQALGILVLIFLAYRYRGGTDQEPELFAPQWWGILGLIGWTYLVAGVLVVFSQSRILILLAVWIFFCALSILSDAGRVPAFLSFIPDAIRDGTLTALTLGGVVTSAVVRLYPGRAFAPRLTGILTAAIILCVVMTVVTRPYWGISKLAATPAWLFLCSAFTLSAFVVLYWVADIYGKASWFHIIRPAGTATLLCYLIPYFAYAFMHFSGLHVPDFALIGALGLLKSFLFALLCVGITGGLLKLGLRPRL